jgi:asparagine synthase (glutamine-hydrolysing)
MHTEVHTFSGVAERDCPETHFIEAVRQTIPVHSHRVRSDEAVQYAQDLEGAILNAAEPIEPTRNYVPRVLYRMAQREGIRVVLDGVDGDIATSQSYTIPYLLKEGRWQSAISQCREVATRRNWSTWSVLRFFGLRPFTPDSILWLWDKLRHNPTRQTELFNKDYVHRIGLSKRIKLFEKQWQLRGHVRKDHAAFVTCGILPFSYEQYDLTAAAIPVEPRHPFSDHRLVEFCLGAPSEQKIRDGYTKSLLRRAADARLSDDVRWRVDKPSVAPQFVSAFLLTKSEFFEEAFSQLDVIRNYINVRQLQRIRRRYHRSNDSLDRYLLLSAAYLVLWLRRTSFTV